MTRAACVLLSTLLTFCAFGQPLNWSQGVVYEYDGSGNVKKIGTDTYVYDTAQRLIRGTVTGSQQSYSYDSFGNRTACQSGVGGDCQGLTVDSETNQIENLEYDERGNMKQLPDGNTLDYDELGMVRKETGSGRQVYYIYTADDERIAVYDADTLFGTHTWRWTVRGLDKKPLRELTSEGTSGTVNFKWAKDHIWRDGALLASRQLDATAPGGVSTYHYHVDHLGTPRQVTNSSAVIIGRHDYLPFGPELSGNANEPQQQNLKFTGHERDFARDHPPLDYMHARYYEGRLGRFLSVDPSMDLKANLPNPQRWNRYSYVSSNPINKTDPDGRDEWAMMQRQLGYEDDWHGRDKYQAAGLTAAGVVVGGIAGGVAATPAVATFWMANKVPILLGAMGFGNAVLGPGGGPPQVHHIATNKNIAGGFTKQFEEIFAKGGMKLGDAANKMSLPGHAGRHSPGYHKYVLDTLQKATEGLSGKAYKEALTGALNMLRKQLEANPDLVKRK